MRSYSATRIASGAARAALYAIAALAVVLGLWGIVSNVAIHLLPGPPWNFFGPFAAWDPAHRPQPAPDPSRPPWWALSLQTGCPYLHPWLGGAVGFGFYALGLTWGLGTILLLRSSLRASPGGAFWPRFLFVAWWLAGLGGIVAHVLFFASIAREAGRAGLVP